MTADVQRELAERLALWLEARGEPIRQTEAARHWLPVAEGFIAKEFAPLIADAEKRAAAAELRAAAEAMRRFANGPGVPSEVAHAVIVLLVGVEARAAALDAAGAGDEAAR